MKGWTLLLTRLVVGGLFVGLSIGKIQHPRVFAEAIAGYDLLPPIIIPMLATILPWLELLAGLCLVLGLLGRSSALWVTLMSLGFTGMVAVALLRGLDIHCGCFTDPRWARVNWRHLLFDLFLVTAGVGLYRRGTGRFSLDTLFVGTASDTDKVESVEHSAEHHPG